MENTLRSSLPDRMGGRTCIVSENAVSIAEAMAREAACYHPILIMWRDAVLFDGCNLTIDEFAAATNKETLDACRQEDGSSNRTLEELLDPAVSATTSRTT